MLRRNKITCLPVFDEVNRQAPAFKEAGPASKGQVQLTRGKQILFLMAAHLIIFYPLDLRAYAFLLRSGRKKEKRFTRGKFDNYYLLIRQCFFDLYPLANGCRGI